MTQDKETTGGRPRRDLNQEEPEMYYYVRDEKQIGPTSLEELRQMVAAGELQANDRIWTEGWSSWQPATHLRELFPGVPPPLNPDQTVVRPHARQSAQRRRQNNVLWYVVGGAACVVVVGGLYFASQRRGRTAEATMQESLEKVHKDLDKLRTGLSNTLNALGEADELMSDTAREHSARPVDADISRYLQTHGDGETRMLLLIDRKITADDLAQIKPLGDGLYISFEESLLPSRSLKQLAGMTLSNLDLSRSSVTDADLADLATLKQLDRLHLNGVAITDAALTHVAKCPGLTRLYLNQTKITDAGLRHLAGMQQLKELHLEGTAVSGQGFSAFAVGKSLEEVNLKGTKVTDQTLPSILRLKMRRLVLEETQVTDSGLELMVEPFPGQVMLAGTRVTEDGVLACEKRLSGISLHGVGPADPGKMEMDRTRKRVDDILNKSLKL